jgi:hypothetical protein
VYERNKNGSGSWSGWVLINAPTSTTPIALTTTRESANTTGGVFEVSFRNGFLTICIKNFKVSAITTGVNVFKIAGVNHTSSATIAIPVIYSEGGIVRLAALTNSGNDLMIYSGWTPWPVTASDVCLIATLPANLTQ